MQSIRKETQIRNTAILLIYCPDKQGILAAVTEFLNENHGNILHLDQHVDHEEEIFYMRVEWELEKFTIPREKIADYFQTLIAQKFAIQFSLHFSDKRPRMAVFVSTMSHCLFDILARYTAGDWETDIPVIISNHDTLRPVAKSFGIDFQLIEKNSGNKAEQELKEIEILKQYNIDFVVLARYMQVLSDKFVANYPNRIINIHHSFLPAFAGAKPYHAAHERGVKIIGATSHYVTTDLDAGPIITQDVVRISHIDNVDSLIRKGRDLEKIVLSDAIYKHLQRKVLVYNNRTVVFN